MLSFPLCFLDTSTPFLRLLCWFSNLKAVDICSCSSLCFVFVTPLPDTRHSCGSEIMSGTACVYQLGSQTSRYIKGWDRKSRWFHFKSDNSMTGVSNIRPMSLMLSLEALYPVPEITRLPQHSPFSSIFSVEALRGRDGRRPHKVRNSAGKWTDKQMREGDSAEFPIIM